MKTGPSWRPATSSIPTSPGVYRYRDESGRVLYVGKAKNLRSRLTSYFVGASKLAPRTAKMIATAVSVDWTLVSSELESLQLEYTWIKEFDPPFNVTFKDDKSYPYLAVTLGEEAPRAIITRNKRIKGARFFGPYPKAWAIREVLALAQRAFPIRTCKDSDYKRAMQTGRPCFASQIGKCAGPCSQRVTIAEHRKMVDAFVKFFSELGNNRKIVNQMRKKMEKAATDQDYETAAKYRDRFLAMEAVLEKTSVVLSDSLDADIFAIFSDELGAAISRFIVRGGAIRGASSWNLVKEVETTDAELLEAAIVRSYEDDKPPAEILVSTEVENTETVTQLLEEIRGAKVEISVPERGKRSALMETVVKNAKETLLANSMKRASDYISRSNALTDLAEYLNLPEIPLRIECYDVSHLSGTDVVASMVVFEDGLPKKNHYRHFQVLDTTDDTASIHQVISRRAKYLLVNLDEDASETSKRFAYPPQLLLIDGGLPQVNAAKRATGELGIEIPVAGIAKRLEEIWIPGEEYPRILPRNSEALFLLQRLRDEAHRFAITYQRSKRRKAIQSVLSEVPGLGDKRIQALIEVFGSVQSLKAASEAEISQVDGIGPVLTKTLEEFLNSAE